MYITHFAELWAYKTKTRFLIMETSNWRNQKQTREESREGSRLEAWGGPWCSRSLEASLYSLQYHEFPKTANTPLNWLQHRETYSRTEWKWPLDYRPNLDYYATSPSAWNPKLYALRGVFTDESALEQARGTGKDSRPLEQQMTCRVLVLAVEKGSYFTYYLIYKVGTRELNFHLSYKDCESSENARRAHQCSNTE